MDEGHLKMVDSGPERQLRNVPSVDSEMVMTPSQSTEHLPDPEVVQENSPEKSTTRPRTRLERLTEKHTPQRPNWAMASLDESPARTYLHTAAKEARQLRRMPNTNLRAGPPREQKNLPRTDSIIEKNTSQAALAHRTTAPNWALAEEQTHQQREPPVLKQDEKRHDPTDSEHTSSRRDYVHPSRAAQIYDAYQPVPAPEPQLTRGPVDAGWGQRRAHQAGKPAASPMLTHQIRHDMNPRNGLIRSDYRERDEHTRWPPKKSNDLRKIASSPNSHSQAASFITDTSYQKSQNPRVHVQIEPSYETQVNRRPDANANQLEFDFSSISLQGSGNDIPEMEIPNSRAMSMHFLGKSQEQYSPSLHLMQNNIRPMHSAPELIQRPPSNQNPAFLHVHRPTPIRATQYVGAFSGLPAIVSEPVALEEMAGYREAIHVPTEPRGLRRVPRFSEMHAAELVHMQHRAMHDRMPGIGPTHNLMVHASRVEAYVLQQRQHLAEERSTADSSPEFIYNGIDSFEKPHPPPQ